MLSLLLVIVFLCTSIMDINSAVPSCHKDWPSSGTWSNSPPFWQPTGGCKSKYFSPSAATNCLQNRTVYVVGSTVARQFAFHVTEVMGAPHANRTIQKLKCPKHEQSWSGCVQQYNGVKVKYLYLQYIDGFNYSHRGGFPYLLHRDTANHVQINSPLDVQPWWQHPTDVCSHATSTVQCLQRFFHGSSTRDLLILNVGLTYGYNLPNKDIDVFGWLKASAVTFKTTLSKVFKGSVYRVTMSQLTKRLSNHSPLLYEVDVILNQVWKNTIATTEEEIEVEGGAWFTIDQWAINKDRDHMYADRIHYPGNLSLATLYQVLSTVCPS